MLVKNLERTSESLKPTKFYLHSVDFVWEEGEGRYFITANTECKILGKKGRGHIIKTFQLPKQGKLLICGKI